MNNKYHSMLSQRNAADEEQERLGKSLSEFSRDEIENVMFKNMLKMEQKNRFLSEQGDTYSGMPWEEFLAIADNLGFNLAYLEYVEDVFSNPKDKDLNVEKYMLMCNPEKGLVLEVTSYGNQKSLGGLSLKGQLYSDIPLEHEEGYPNSIILTDNLRSISDALEGCSRSGLNNVNQGLNFSYDSSDALVNKLNKLSEHCSFKSIWSGHDLIFLSWTTMKEHKENKNYEDATYEKIIKCSDEFKSIIQPWISKYEEKQVKSNTKETSNRPSMKDMFKNFLS